LGLIYAFAGNKSTGLGDSLQTGDLRPDGA
jgi:hypothetical protein